MTPEIHLTDIQLTELANLAEQAALSAGKMIASRRQTDLDVQHKDRGDTSASQVVTEVDHLAQAIILDILQPTCEVYNLALLTEESPDDGQRLIKPAFWCIDPLDGTLAFIRDEPGFSVSIALVAKDGTPLIGIAYDPVESVMYRAIKGHGAFRNDKPMRLNLIDPTQPLTLRTDYSFEQHALYEATIKGLKKISEKLGLNGSSIELATGGVIMAIKVLEDPNYCYFKYPRKGNAGGSLWDYPASVCLFNELGAIATDIYGNSLELNRAVSTYMNHRGILFAAEEILAQQIRALHKSLIDM